MKRNVILFFLLSIALLGATPDFLSFRLMLTQVGLFVNNTVEIGGDFTITNNSLEDWTYMFEYPIIGNIWVDEQEPPFYYFDLWTWVTIPANGSVTYQIGGGGIPYVPGLHTAKARLFYNPAWQEPVGNTIDFSLDETLTEINDVTWNLLLTEVGANYLAARMNMANENNYNWQREFPFATIARLSVDGVPPDVTCDPFPHLEYLAPHQDRAMELGYAAPADFSPGYHTAQINLLTPDPVPVGPVLTFYVQGSAVGDVPAPAFTAKLSPNPISDATSLELESPDPGQLSISLYNLKGQKILSRSGLSLRQGLNEWQWKALVNEQLPAGIYLLRLDSGGHSSQLKAMLLP